MQCINQTCCLSGFLDVKKINYVMDCVEVFVKDAVMDFVIDFAKGLLNDCVKEFWRILGRIL